MKLSSYIWVLALIVTGQSLFAEKSPNQLLDLLEADPSLILDPQASEPKPDADLAEAPTKEAEPEKKEVEPAKKEAEPVKEVVTKVEEKAPELPQPKPLLPVLAPKLVAKPPTPKPEPEPILIPEPAPVVPAAAVPASQVAPIPVVSELKVVPGVNDIAIIFSNNQFYPSRIQMKATLKSRLIVTTTEKKPAALVFTKQKVQRWIASDSKRFSEEYREISPSRIAEIQFDAEPGVYQFYDAISGASGEIQVE